MSREGIAVTGVAVTLLTSLLVVTPPVAAQSASAEPGAEPVWAPPRTVDGRPDLRGYWTNDSYTPLERPAEFADKAVFTDEEAAAFVQRRLDQLQGQPSDSIHYDDAIWQRETYTKEAYHRTSLITDPPDGKLPPLSRSGQQRAVTVTRALRDREGAEGAEQRSLGERCISWGNVGPPMVPPTYNANLQILQAPDLVVIRHEMMHDVRLIPLDGRPRPGERIRQLAGVSRGHWEGDTLVVETTHFTNDTNFRGSPANTRQDIFASDSLHVVERFTLVADDTIRYEFTVEDPATWTRPWSGEMPIRRFGGPIFEFACHEGNYGLPNILSAIRANEE